MSRNDRPLPDGETDRAMLDEINRQLAEFSQKLNTSPDPEMGNLSPSQIADLLYSEWNTPESPIRFNVDIPLVELESSPFFVRARTLLCAIHDHGGVKATEGKKLTRKFVEGIVDSVLTAKQCADIRRFNKVINEPDAWPLHAARVVAQVAGMTLIRGGEFIVPKAKVSLLAQEKAGELFCRLFVGFFRKLDLSYLDGYSVEAPSIQSCAGYTLYRLGIVAANWHDTVELHHEVLLPAVREEVSSKIKDCSSSIVSDMLSTRILSHLFDWGLLEGRYDNKANKYIEALVSIRVTPLYGKFFRFHI